MVVRWRRQVLATFVRTRFGGCMLPGYPEIDPLDPDFWIRFWRIHAALCKVDQDPAVGESEEK